VFVVLQNGPDTENPLGMYSNICPASACDEFQANSIKAEVFSDREEEDYSVPFTFVGIKFEPEENCEADEAINVDAEVLSDTKQEEHPVPTTSIGIKVESEVSCISVRWISQIQLSLIL
jgi:hypothetical protein